MSKIDPFRPQTLEAVCRVIADTERGLSAALIIEMIYEY